MPDTISPQFYALDSQGRITGFNIPVSPFSSSIRWVRQADGATVATITEQNFGSAPNRQQNLQLAVQEPADAGANTLAEITAIASIPGIGASIARTLLEVNGGFGVFTPGVPVSDWLLQERLSFTAMAGNPGGFVIDNNYRIYDLIGSITFQNSSISGDNWWAIGGRLTMPQTQGCITYVGNQGGISGTTRGVFASVNGGAIVQAGNEGVANFASSPGNSNVSAVNFYRLASGTTIQWSGWNNNITPTAYLGVLGVPFALGQI